MKLINISDIKLDLSKIYYFTTKPFSSRENDKIIIKNYSQELLFKVNQLSKDYSKLYLNKKDYFYFLSEENKEYSIGFDPITEPTLIKQNNCVGALGGCLIYIKNIPEGTILTEK